MCQKTTSCLTLGALFLLGGTKILAAEQPKPGLTILVLNYAGIDDQTLRAAEGEADRILRHAGVEVGWQHCYSAAKRPETECPDVGVSTPALRLISHFQFVAGQVRADTMGYAIGYMMTVSWEEVQNVAQSGAGPVSQILGLTIAHELGHLLLGSAHSISGIMRARWGLEDWAMARQQHLVFLPWQAAALRKELRARSETSLAARNSRQTRE